MAKDTPDPKPGDYPSLAQRIVKQQPNLVSGPCRYIPDGGVSADPEERPEIVEPCCRPAGDND